MNLSVLIVIIWHVREGLSLNHWPTLCLRPLTACLQVKSTKQISQTFPLPVLQVDDATELAGFDQLQCMTLSKWWFTKRCHIVLRLSTWRIICQEAWKSLELLVPSYNLDLSQSMGQKVTTTGHHHLSLLKKASVMILFCFCTNVWHMLSLWCSRWKVTVECSIVCPKDLPQNLVLLYMGWL